AGKSFRRVRSIGNGAFANAAAANEDLGLEELFAFAGFALHVIDRVLVANVGVKAKDHLGSGFPRWCCLIATGFRTGCSSRCDRCVPSAAKAAIERKPDTAAVNRCATQK